MLIWGYSFLKGSNLFTTGEVYYAVYERVDGLAGGEAVQINGLTVGKVLSVEFMPNLDGTIIVSFKKNDDFPITKTTVATIASDFLGSKSLKLDVKPGKLAERGDTLKSNIASSLSEDINRQVLPIKQKAESLMESVDSVITYIKLFFNKDARDYVKESFVNINRTFSKVDSLLTSINRVVLTNEETFKSVGIGLDSLGYVIRRNTNEIDQSISNLTAISDSLAQADLTTLMNNLSSTLAGTDSIFRMINSKEGNLGRLVYDEELYNNLVKSSNELAAFLEDFKLNPQRYVNFSIIGRKQKPYKPEP